MLGTIPNAGGTHPPDFIQGLSALNANTHAEAVELAHPSFIDTEESLASPTRL